MKVVVVGGGIGGLVLAVALERVGATVEVIERRRRFGDEGAGIVLGPNAMRVLGEIGLADPIRARGRRVRGARVADRHGHTLLALGDDALEATAIHRAELHEVLQDAVEAPIRLGVAPTQVDTDDSGATVRLDDGTERRADLLVGADGIHSAVRAAVFGEIPVRYSGCTCWRTVVDREVIDEPLEVWGRGRRAGLVPLPGGRSYVYVTLNAPRRAPAPFEDLDGLRRTFAGLAAPVDEALLGVRSLDDLLHNDLEDVLAPEWSRGRVVLVGDAAHATTPNMGQGASMAIEDAPVLARWLRDRGATSAALLGYQTERFERVRSIRARSYQIGWFGQLSWGPAVWARDLVARLTPSAAGRRQLEALLAGTPRLAA